MNLHPGSTSQLALFLDILSLALFRAFGHSLAEHGGELGDAVSGEARIAAQIAFGAELDRRGLRILQDLVRVSGGNLIDPVVVYWWGCESVLRCRRASF